MTESIESHQDHSSTSFFDAQKKFFAESWKYRKLAINVFKHNYIYQHKDTWLGIVWLFVNPCIPVFIYMLLQFLNVFSSSYEGIPRAVFLTLGIILYYSFSESLNGFTSFLSYNRTFLKSGGSNKTAVILATFMVPGCNFLIRMILFLIVVLLNGLTINVWILILPFAFFMLSLLGGAIGLVLSVFNLLTRDIANFVSLVSFYLLFASGVFGVIEPTNLFLSILAHSPVYMIIESMRQLLFFGELPSQVFMLVGTFIPILLFSFSIVAFYRVEFRVNSYL